MINHPGYRHHTQCEAVRLNKLFFKKVYYNDGGRSAIVLVRIKYSKIFAPGNKMNISLTANEDIPKYSAIPLLNQTFLHAKASISTLNAGAANATT